MRASRSGRNRRGPLHGAALFAVALVAAACASGDVGTDGDGVAASGPAPLVLVSFDGFRWDYPDLYDTPTLDAMAAAGARAERLVPVFPSKTFPGHYSVVTGLYPGHHGIVSNNIRDPRWDEAFGLGRRDEVQNGRWWGGEPIWVTAHDQGLRSAVYFWPGSEAPINGVRPDWWFPYDGAVAWETRLEQAFEWLTLPAQERPALVALYFEEPNDAGHEYGPLTPETAAAVSRADAILGKLIDGLRERGVVANVVVVADHGMAANDPERVIVLDDHVTLERDELFEFGAIGQVFPRPGREEEVFEALHGAHPELAVYRRGEFPESLHLYDNPRLPPILLVPTAGWEVVPRAVLERGGGRVIAGDHGQDPAHPDLHGIFYAAGPDIALGAGLGAVHQVDVYGLLCDLLGLQTPPNDGDPVRIAGALARR